jgi:excisionase family DNA binding protein
MMQPKPMKHPNASDMTEILTAREVEALLKIDVKTIYEYVQRGLIPYIRIQSNLRFYRHQILEWVAAQSHVPSGARTGRAKTQA